MMGRQKILPENLFLYNISLEDRVRKDHPLRRIKQLIDFEFIYNEVKDKYGRNGNVSLPPPVILKLMFLLFYYNVRSERELMDTIPERIDWLWFLGFSLDSSIPNHSVLSKARKRWGAEIFKQFFERVVIQCVEQGLVDGTKIFMDASLIDANASNNSVIDIQSLSKYLHSAYEELEKRLEDKDQSGVNASHISLTDPDAAIVRHQKGKPKLQYKTHRAVDSLNDIITAVEVTTGSVYEADKMVSLIDEHTNNTLIKPDTVVADSAYGTIDNLLECHDRQINPHIPAIQTRNKNTGLRKHIYPEEMFIYNENTDTITCPAGNTLTRRAYHSHRNNIEYTAKGKDCRACKLKSQCTTDNNGRSIQRHIRKKELDKMISITKSYKARRDLKIRQYLMERSYARSTRYGFDRARWRGLYKVNIQEYIICTIQNIEILIRYMKKPVKRIMVNPLKQTLEYKIIGGLKKFILDLIAILFCYYIDDHICYRVCRR